MRRYNATVFLTLSGITQRWIALLLGLGASSLILGGNDRITALLDGYHLAFLIGALFALSAAIIGGTLLRTKIHSPAEMTHL